MTDTSIYAELLLNIRQITVVVSLPSPYNDATNVRLSEDCQSLSVIHDGRLMAIRLPAPVRHAFNSTVAPGSTRALSFRLPILDEASYKMSTMSDGLGPKSLSAASMGPTTQVACRFCQTLLVRKQVTIWKDLPSENWAEMMDFWHCHKPDTDDFATQKQDGGRKGYGAASSIRPTSATGLVDIISLHLVQQDCNVTVSEDLKALMNGKFQRVVNCASCKHPVGVAAGTDARIYKWNISLRSDPQLGWEDQSAQKLISAQLLAMIESQGIQKFVIHSETRDDNTEALLVSDVRILMGSVQSAETVQVWIFTPNMYFSSTLVPQSPKQVMKLYYKTVPNPEELLEQESSKIDELQLPIELGNSRTGLSDY
ncbi:MAG: hypothetical protein LQ339_005032 [Xanthoria mediterranea]|nr:MAG: hypothetical protein LQ339_005032 [Xanthoria mediterranea]